MSLQNSPPRFTVHNPDAVDAPPPFYAFNTHVLLALPLLLIIVIFFLLMIHAYARWFSRHRRSSAPSVTSRGVAAPCVAQRNRTGLDMATIAQLPTFVYSAPSPVDNLEAGKLDDSVMMPAPECAVCLSEFQANEKVRMLPACKHIFHTECIDKWFFENFTCPLCRTNVIPAIATSTGTTSTDQNHQEQQAMEPSQNTRRGNSVTLHMVEYPCNVLFWGNPTRVVPSRVPSNSSSPVLPPSLHMANARALPQLTIDISPIEGNVLVSAGSGCLSAKCITEQEAGSSQPLKSSGLHASIERMLSRQFSRHKSPSEEGNEGSPK